MKKTLSILVYCATGLFSLFSMASAFPLTACAFNRYMQISDACRYSRYAALLFGIVGLVAAVRLVIGKGTKALAWILVASLLFQIAIVYRTFNIRPEVSLPDGVSLNDPNMIPTQPPPAATSSVATTSAPGSATVPPKPATTPSDIIILKNGQGTLKLNQTGTFGNFSITPIAVVEDSRCPSDVQCIWAGRARIMFKVKIGNSNGFEKELEVGKSAHDSDFVYELKDVSPQAMSTHAIANGEYRFSIRVSHMIVDY